MTHKKKKKDRVSKIEKDLEEAKRDLIAGPDRDEKGRFLKGNTESKGLTRKNQKHVVNYIMLKTDGLATVLDKAYAMLMSEKTSNGDKIRLIELFLNRAIGKPVQMTQIDNEAGLPTLIFNFNNTDVEVEEWQDSEKPTG